MKVLHYAEWEHVICGELYYGLACGQKEGDWTRSEWVFDEVRKGSKDPKLARMTACAGCAAKLDAPPAPQPAPETQGPPTLVNTAWL